MLHQAKEYYNDALKSSEGHAKSMLALAKLHLADSNVDQCQQMVSSGVPRHSANLTH
jgi:hypothetical protein